MAGWVDIFAWSIIGLVEGMAARCFWLSLRCEVVWVRWLLSVITVESAVLFPINRRRIVSGHVVYFLSLAGFFYQVRSKGHVYACINARLSLAVVIRVHVYSYVRFRFFFFLPRWRPGRLLCHEGGELVIQQ